MLTPVLQLLGITGLFPDGELRDGVLHEPCRGLQAGL